jgi:hypothetical protein
MEWLQDQPNPVFQLDREELVRMNQLARVAPCLDGYLAWYEELSECERIALTCALLRYGTEYNDGSRWSEFVAAAGLVKESHVAVYIWSCHREGWWKFDNKELFSWLASLDANDQRNAFKLAASFFGLNERRRFEACKASAGGCTHWWHQV